MQNPIGEAELEWILHRNCEGTEQLLYKIVIIITQKVWKANIYNKAIKEFMPFEKAWYVYRMTAFDIFIPVKSDI